MFDGRFYYLDKRKEYSSIVEVDIAARQEIDRAFILFEEVAKVQRELTKNDFDGFVDIFQGVANNDEDINTLAVLMLKAHYQRLLPKLIDIDMYSVSTAIDGLTGAIESSFKDGYQDSVGAILRNHFNV